MTKSTARATGSLEAPEASEARPALALGGRIFRSHGGRGAADRLPVISLMIAIRPYPVLGPFVLAQVETVLMPDLHVDEDLPDAPAVAQAERGGPRPSAVIVDVVKQPAVRFGIRQRGDAKWNVVIG